MPNQPNGSPESLSEPPKPLYTQRDAFVENVFKEPTTAELPDLTSQNTASEYLSFRQTAREPRERLRFVVTHSETRLPKLTREVVGTEPFKGWQKTREWRVSPAKAAAVWLSTLVAFNISSIAGDVGDEIDQGVYHAKEALGIVPDGEWQTGNKKITNSITPIVIKRHISGTNLPGSAEVDGVVVNSFRKEVLAAAKPGANTKVTVEALSSDDAGADATLGVPESPLQDMADDRAKSWTKAVKKAMPNVDVSTKIHQDILNKRQLRKLSKIARDSGFSGENMMVDAVRAAEAGQGSKKLRKFVAKNFERGVVITGKVQNPDVQIKLDVPTLTYMPGRNEKPDDPNRDYKPMFVPLPFWRKRKYVELGQRDIKKWKWVPGRRLLKGQFIREGIDQAWLGIRPEAVKENGTLVTDSWAYTRKYEHLAREDRIKRVLRADFRDGENRDASLRIIFVDKDPEQETIEAFTDLLKNMAAMQKGAIAQNVTGMFVFPSEQAGRGDRNPKNIGPGIDEQYSRSTLGVMYYPLKLVEMHMPASLRGDKLREHLKDYMGVIYTAAHEAAGHGTDVSDKEMRLKRIYSPNVRNAHIFRGDPRAARFEKLSGVLKPLQADPEEPKLFEVAYPVPDKNGHIFMMTDVVPEGDSRLAHAHTAYIVGRRNTNYASTNTAEHYAETAGSYASGIPVPFSEAGVSVSQIKDGQVIGDFANGYFPDRRAVDAYAKSIGATVGNNTLVFTNSPDVEILSLLPKDDTLINRQMTRARQIRFAKPNELIAILTQTSRRKS